VSAREPARVQLRVSARQPAGIAILRRRLVGKGRESHDLRTCAPPTIEKMWIDEGESSILRECDARSGRRKGRCLLCLSEMWRDGKPQDAVQVEVGLGDCREAVEPFSKVSMLAGLNEAKMPLWQSDHLITRHRAENGDARCCDGVGHEFAMPLAADAIEHDTADLHLRDHGGEAAHRSAAADCDCPETSMTSKTGRTETGGEVGGRAVRRGAASIPSNRPMTAFDHEHIGARSRLSTKRVEQRGPHGPTVEIDALSAGRGLVEGRVDIVGAGLGRLHGKPAPFQRREQAKRHRGLACAGARRGDDETAGRHPAHHSSDRCDPGRYSGGHGNEGTPLRRGWTTGTCATAAAKAAYAALLTGEFPDPVEVTLPRGGGRPAFALATTVRGEGPQPRAWSRTPATIPT
jgi:hypothetical protein